VTDQESTPLFRRARFCTHLFLEFAHALAVFFFGLGVIFTHRLNNTGAG